MVPKKRDSMVSVLCLFCLIVLCESKKRKRESKLEKEKCLEAEKMKENETFEGFFFLFFF